MRNKVLGSALPGVAWPRMGLRGLLVLCTAVLLSACGPKDEPPKLDSLIQRVLTNLWEYHPERATAAGLEGYEGRLFPSSREDRMREIESVRALLAEAENFPSAGLDPEEIVDLRLLVADLRIRLSQLVREKTWQTDPTIYVPFDALNDLVRNGLDDLRAQHLLSLLHQVPRVLEDGRRNLEHPRQLLAETALRTARSLDSFYRETLVEASAQVPELKPELSEAAALAAGALQSFADDLENRLIPQSNPSVAVGRELYDFYLEEMHLLNDDADSLLAKGQSYYAEALKELEDWAAEMDRGRDWAELTEEIREQHPSREKLLDAYCDEIQRARQFVIERGLVSMPTGEEVRCYYTPESQRAFSPFGDFRTPPPFSGQKTGYLVLHPVEAGLAGDVQERLLRAHDYTWISVIAPHEAYPGHHLQALKAQENPRILRKVLSSPLFSEGWGLYCEELAWESGFFRDPKATRLTQLRLRLWRAARVLLDIQLHTGKISYEEAREFLVKNIRFDADATAGEVNIYAFRPTYAISYMVGYHELMKLRAEFQQKQGQAFSLREFHDRVLGKGSIPFSLLRPLLFGGA